MIASLPMYDRAETAPAHDRLWHAIRAHLACDAPHALTRDGDPWQHWQSPELMLSQTCGYPYRARLHGKVTLVAAPVLDLPDLDPGTYCSVFVVRRDDPRSVVADFAQAVLAYNDPLSQSGWAAPQTHAAGLGFRFAGTLLTGAHRASARAVAEARADIAALDILSWTLIRQHDDFAADLRVIDRTAPTPALPYITALGRDPAPLFAALEGAIGALSEPDRRTLCLRGVTAVDAGRYLAVPTPPPPATGT